MKTIVTALTVLALVFSGMPALASSGHGDMGKMDKADKGMDAMGFTHEAVVDGLRSEFQIMSLASMKMKDEHGATHHIMVKLMDEATHAEIKQAVGKIKIIGPDGAEQESTLKNYSGIFAANFSFAASGKYGVICLLKVDGQKRVVKFWYPHHG